MSPRDRRPDQADGAPRRPGYRSAGRWRAASRPGRPRSARPAPARSAAPAPRRGRRRRRSAGSASRYRPRPASRGRSSTVCSEAARCRRCVGVGPGQVGGSDPVAIPPLGQSGDLAGQLALEPLPLLSQRAGPPDRGVRGLQAQWGGAGAAGGRADGGCRAGPPSGRGSARKVGRSQGIVARLDRPRDGRAAHPDPGPGADGRRFGSCPEADSSASSDRGWCRRKARAWDSVGRSAERRSDPEFIATACSKWSRAGSYRPIASSSPPRLW